MYLFFLYIKKKKNIGMQMIALKTCFLKKNFNLFTRVSFKFNLLEKML